MSTKSSTSSSGPGTGLNPVGRPPLSDEAPTSTAEKSAATKRRHKEERRAESLRDIRAQTADGTLVVRQMTAAQHEAASEVARETLARNQARGDCYGASRKPER